MLVNSQLCRLANNDYLWKRLCQKKIKILNPGAAKELSLNVSNRIFISYFFNF